MCFFFLCFSLYWKARKILSWTLFFFSWRVEGEPLQHLSAKYCSLGLPPNSTIAAAFSSDGKNLASTHWVSCGICFCYLYFATELTAVLLPVVVITLWRLSNLKPETVLKCWTAITRRLGWWVRECYLFFQLRLILSLFLPSHNLGLWNKFYS